MWTAAKIAFSRLISAVNFPLRKYEQKLLTWRSSCLQKTNRYFGPYGSSMIIKSTIEFIESTNIENDFNEFAPIDAVRFPHYLRLKTGMPEVYAHTIFPNDLFPESQFRKFYLPAMPALCDIINYVNDLLSFYKETIQGTERINYICTVAKSTSKTALQCLYDISDVIEKCVAEMRRVLQPHSALLAHANDFVTNYISWHLYTTSRYHLNEVKIIIGEDLADLVNVGMTAAASENEMVNLGATDKSNSVITAANEFVTAGGA